jgi:hypothetical protein
MSIIRKFGDIVTTDQLAKDTAGGDNFIRTKGGVVKGLALRRDLNPDAPNIVIVGLRKQREARASKLLALQSLVPAYMKRGTNDWEYIGEYKAIAYRTDKATVARYSKLRKSNVIAGALFLEPGLGTPHLVDETPLEALPNYGFPDAKTRKAIEEAAISHAKQELESRGYTIHDHQTQNLGYDLLAVKGRSKLLVEVKGTDSPRPQFFLSRNERKCSLRNPEWRLAIVCSARTAPELFEYTTQRMEKTFAFSALAWACSLM